MLADLKPEWNALFPLTFDERLKAVLEEKPDSIELWHVFPGLPLSRGIDPGEMIQSFFSQPDLFIRVRPGKMNIVKEKLQKAGIEFRELPGDCLAFTNQVQLDKILSIDTEALIQDYSSQRVGGLIPQLPPGARVWDCCAGSGGKSILAADTLGKMDLLVTDIRSSVLANLRKRFDRAGLKNYRLKQMDLTKKAGIPDSNFELIIADLPCTGSGTWSRTPEQLYYFAEEKAGQFSALQKKICSNIIQALEPGAFLLYVTCSVFQQENEENISFLEKEFGMQVLKMKLIKGYKEKADTLFASLLLKPKA